MRHLWIVPMFFAQFVADLVKDVRRPPNQQIFQTYRFLREIVSEQERVGSEKEREGSEKERVGSEKERVGSEKERVLERTRQGQGPKKEGFRNGSKIDP